jgi:hypothetical protein
LGGGGGGGDPVGNRAGGAGGTGVVIIAQDKGKKFPTTLTNAVITADASNIIFTFNTTGTIGWSA